MSKFKVACLQFAPQVGQIEQNIQKANSILQNGQLEGNQIDWLILPELAFTGYNFQSLEEIQPFLEPTASGVSTKWAQATAQALYCHVTVGYPEITQTAQIKHYNSTVTVSPEGQVIANYRKTFLYYTDELWADEGDQRFFSGTLGRLGQVSLGICMDINPYKFLAPWSEYEFATNALAAGSPLICLSMAWLTRLTPENITSEPHKEDMETLAYWVERFYPLQNHAAAAGHPPNPPVIIILANRCGQEGGVCYAGTSAVLGVENGAVTVYDLLGKNEEKLLVVDLNQKPKFALRAAPTNTS